VNSVFAGTESGIVIASFILPSEDVLLTIGLMLGGLNEIEYVYGGFPPLTKEAICTVSPFLGVSLERKADETCRAWAVLTAVLVASCGDDAK